MKRAAARRRAVLRGAVFLSRTPRLRSLIYAVFALFALAGGEQWLSGRVTSVADGDTINVYTSFGQTERIRLYGIDCPENAQAGGEQAAAFTRALVLYKKVDLRLMSRDAYERCVAVVTLQNGTVLNEELLRNGHAWLYAQYCKAPPCRLWKRLENEAKEAQRGLWAASSPRAPWKWRQANPR